MVDIYIYTYLYVYVLVESIRYRVYGIWYILLEVQGSYNQAITEL